MTYDKLRDTIQENNLSWTEIDHILLNTSNYKQLQESASFDLDSHYTSDRPAVRETDGQEKLIYVSESGIEVTIEL